MGEDPPQPPTYGGTLAKPCLFPSLSVPVCTIVGYNWVSHSLGAADSLGRRCACGVSSPRKSAKGLGVQVESRKRERTPVLGNTCIGDPGLQGPKPQTAPPLRPVNLRPQPSGDPGAYTEVHLDVAGCGGRYGCQDILHGAHLAYGHGGCVKRRLHLERRQPRSSSEKPAPANLHLSLTYVPGILALYVIQGKLFSIAGPQ